MSTDRLTFALTQGGLGLPDDGTIALVRPVDDQDLELLPIGRLTVVHSFRPSYDHWTARGVPVSQSLLSASRAAESPLSAVVTVLPRARDLAQASIAQAASVCRDGLIVVDGAKTDGVDAVLKSVRDRTPVLGQLSKAHGRVFWFNATDVFSDWASQPKTLPGGFVTVPGVFSADAPDPGSVALAAVLPDKLGAQVIDLGAGWGYLSAQILQKTGLQTLHLVEAEALALECAERNLHDSRVQCHWQDATKWTPPEPVDSVVMNPPFHTGRTADPALGQAFVAAAARMLKPNGSLWMVANRHLPYEAALNAAFRNVDALAGAKGYKLFHASKPTRAKR